MASTSATPSPAQLPPHVHPLQDGDPGRIGDYTIIGRLGSGGMGTVYAGVSDELGRVAVKVAHPAPGEQSQGAGSGGSESRANTRFKREIELMRRVQGVCAVTVHDSGEYEGRPWAAIEYVPGLDLHRYVREHGPLTGDPSLLLAAGCAEALAAVHGARVAHGDIKPGNALMAPGGPKVVDYGIARLLEDLPTGTVSGSLGWMAPERYRGTEPEPESEAPADPDAPYTFDYVQVLAGPGEPAYRASGMNWFGGSTVTMSVDGELVYGTPDGGWVGASPGDRTNPDAHATEHIFEVFSGMLDAGQNTDEEESDFVPIPVPEAEFDHPEADPVDTAVRIDGEITHEGLEGEVTTAYALVTTPEGVPLSFSWALAQTNYDEWSRPVSLSE
ncbi:serine/threonine-protein kinase [Nocardiopsis oceani]